MYLDVVIGFSFFSYFFFKKGIITIDTRREVGILHVVSYKVSYLLQGVPSLYYYTDVTGNIVRNTIRKQQKSVYKFKMINRSSQKRNAHTKHVRSLAEYIYLIRFFLSFFLLFARPFELDEQSFRATHITRRRTRLL